MNDFIPVITIEDKYYKYRKLGIDDVTEILEVVSLMVTQGFERLQLRVKTLKDLASSGIHVNENGEPDPEQLRGYIAMLTLAFGIREVANAFKSFVSRSLRKTDEEGRLKGDFVSMEELSDPELFPAYSICHLLVPRRANRWRE